MIFQILKPNNKQLEEISDSEYHALFKQFYKPIRSFIYYRCGDVDMAEDLTQDVFVKLWENKHKIDKRTVKAYLYTIAQNTTINQLKRNQLLYKFRKIPGRDRDGDTPEKLMEMQDYEQKLANVIALLPEGGREVFFMNRLEDLTYAEIAERLGLSVKAVEKRMSKVLSILREKLGTEL